MPVYGQTTEYNERLCSLMSCVFCNSNHLYDGGTSHTTKSTHSSSPAHLSSFRPLFTEAVLRKASRLNEIRWKPKSLAGEAIPNAPTVLEVVLVFRPEDSTICDLLCNLISHLLVMPEEHASNLVLEVTPVCSNSIRDDLVVKHLSHTARRRQVFVGLGSAIEGLCLYLHQEEVSRLQFRETTKRLPSPPSTYLNSIILGVVCIDVPLHLWKACGRTILDLTSIRSISSFYIGYTAKDDDGAEEIPTELRRLLDDSRCYPHALALVATESAKVLDKTIDGINATEDEKRGFDACVWTARLVSKYVESVFRIRNPPTWSSSGRSSRINNEKVRSML